MEKADEILNYLSYYVDAIQDGYPVEFITTDLGCGCLSLELDDSKIQQYIKEKSKVDE